jgi:hypothetical protein
MGFRNSEIGLLIQILIFLMKNDQIEVAIEKEAKQEQAGTLGDTQNKLIEKESVSVEVICHHCDKSLPENKVVKCQNIECKTYYCRVCLSRKYKFSKKAARLLPTVSWKCPKCTCRCRCKK